MRRNQIYEMSRAELSIREAMLSLEEAGADVRLTAASNHLLAARELAAEYQDTQPPSVATFGFGLALALLRDGGRVRRRGWNGKGMWIALTRGLELRSQGGNLRGAALHRSAEIVAERGDLAPHPFQTSDHIDMRAADGTVVIGWLASQTDLLALDWEVVP
jgi:hypothetical protein